MEIKTLQDKIKNAESHIEYMDDCIDKVRESVSQNLPSACSDDLLDWSQRLKNLELLREEWRSRLITLREFVEG